MPPETQGIVVIDGHICESSWIANKVTVGRYGADFNVIQDAIDYAVSQIPTAASPWTVEIYSGTYDEALIMGDHVNLVGVGERGAILIQTGAGDIITVGNVTCHLTHLRLDHSGGGAGACIAVTNAGSDILLEYCHIIGMPAPVHVIEMTAGELRLHSCEVIAGDIDLSAAACTFVAHYTMVENGDIDLAGAYDHDLRLHYVDMHGGDIANAATGAVDIDLRYCSNIGTFTDAGLVGTVIIEYSVITTATKSGTSPWVSRLSDLFILSNTNLTGAITCYAGLIYRITRAIGPIVWWWDTNTLKVIPSGTVTDTVIQWAVDADGVAAGDTIIVHPGTYQESVALAAGINLVGIDKDNCIINGTAVTLITMAEGCRIANITLNATATGGNAIGIEGNDSAFTVENVNINLVRTNNNAYAISELTGNAAKVIYIRNVRVTSDIDTNESGIICDQANKTFYIEESWIQGGDYAINCNAASIFYVDHTFLDVVVVPPGGGTTIYAAAATMYFRNCTIEKQITAGNLGIIRLKNCSYRQINRSGTGNIVDESPDLKDAPWHTERWDWQAALANAQVAVRGTPIDAGSGQVQLEVTDNAAGQEAVEALPAVAGAHDVSVLPARTPRCLMQFLADAFDAHGTMFFGLRHTLGNDVPAATEEHAGFIWDGGNFKASSDDGAATEATNLTTPTVDVHNQLEIIVFGGHSVEFYVSGILVATHITRVPSGTLDWQHLQETAGSDGGDVLQVTVRPGGVQECPA